MNAMRHINHWTSRILPQLPSGALMSLLGLCLVVVGATGGAQAQGLKLSTALSEGWEGAHWRAVVSPYAPHLRPSDEHRHVWAVGLERQRSDDWLVGGSYFSNSFGQPSGYAYAGKRFPGLWGQPQLFGQVSAGIIYGYRGKYKNKVPMNFNGFSPGALVSLGWQIDPHWSITAHAIGDAAVMFQLGRDLR